MSKAYTDPFKASGCRSAVEGLRLSGFALGMCVFARVLQSQSVYSVPQIVLFETLDHWGYPQSCGNGRKAALWTFWPPKLPAVIITPYERSCLKISSLKPEPGHNSSPK